MRWNLDGRWSFWSHLEASTSTGATSGKSGWNWCHTYNYLIEDLIKDDALTEYAWKEVAQKMYDDVLSSQMGIDNKNYFSISPESIQLKPELRARIKEVCVKEELPEPVLDDLEAMVDMHTESHRD